MFSLVTIFHDFQLYHELNHELYICVYIYIQLRCLYFYILCRFILSYCSYCLNVIMLIQSRQLLNWDTCVIDWTTEWPCFIDGSDMHHLINECILWLVNMMEWYFRELLMIVGDWFVIIVWFMQLFDGASLV